ncbi:hypothetical protein PS15p_212136 [Mucor circinelloides]
MANTTTQPTLQDDKATAKIIDKIKQLQTSLNAKNRPATAQRKDKLLLELNQEYERLAHKRQDQCNSLVEGWQSYQLDQKNDRQSDIAKRQIEFDRQLDALDEEKRKSWVSQTQDKPEICNQLLHYLKHCSTESALLTFPTDVLDQFWELQIQVPVLQAELPLTIAKLNGLLKDQMGSS